MVFVCVYIEFKAVGLKENPSASSLKHTNLKWNGNSKHGLKTFSTKKNETNKNEFI